jgi:hypothetical protein
VRRTPSRLSALLASLALTASATTLVAGTPTAADAATADKVRIGTYNIRAGVSTRTFSRVVHDLLPNAGLIGLQEVNSHDKEDVLAHLRGSGWRYFRADQGRGEQNPVLWRASRFTKLSARSVRTSGAGGGVGPHFASVVRLKVRATGERVTVVNVHLPPGAIKRGLPNRQRSALFARYADELAASVRLARSESRAGAGHPRVFLTGDLNAAWIADHQHQHPRLPIRVSRSVDMRSMWATERPAGTRGTHESSLIDQVIAHQPALDARVLFGIKGSDHFPAVATYPARR